MKKRKQPIQPIVSAPGGIFRFQENQIVRYLLDNGGMDINHLAARDFPQEDWEQFAQLIGYTITGFSGLSYVSDETYDAASRMMHRGDDNEQQARIDALEKMLAAARAATRALVPAIFRNHPDDLTE